MLFKLVSVLSATLVVFIDAKPSMHIDIKPHKSDGVIINAFEISCTPVISGDCATSILAIQVSKDGGRPLATLQQNSNISVNQVLKGNIEAKGNIGKDVSTSKLAVTFSDALKEDSGLYTCWMAYLDELGYMAQEEASENFTVNYLDAHHMVRLAMKKLASMEEVLQRQQRQIDAQKDETGRLENVITSYGQKDDSTAAFLVGYKQNGVRQGQVLKFSQQMLNMGGSYNKDSGVFTTPVDGLYIFHLFVRSHAKVDINVDITYNKTVAARLKSLLQTNPDQSSVSCVLRLNAGEMVECMMRYMSGGDMLLDDFPYTGFTGHLIKRL